MTTFRKYATRRNAIYAAILLAIVLAFFLFSGSKQSEAQTITVTAGPFEQTISVAGTVTPSREVDLGFTTGGRIVQVNARVGSVVGQGTVLAATDSSDLRANVMQREAAVENQKARLESVKLGARPEEIAVAQASVDSAETSLAQANDALIDAIRDAYVKSDHAVRVQTHQFVNTPRTNPQLNFSSSDSQAAIQLQNDILQAEAMFAAWQSDNLNLNAESDLSAAVTKTQANLAFVSALLARASHMLTNAIASPSVSATTIAGYASDISSARASVSTSNAAVQSALTAQKSAISSLESAKKNLALKEAGPVQADITAQEAQVRSAEADLANARSLLSKTTIVAPFSGVVTTMDAKVGLIASPNTPLITMIAAGTFQIESYVPEVNIGLVAVNNPATVTLDAYGEDAQFEARVVSIDPAATVREGVPTYRAVLQFSTADERIKSGMTANVVITTAQKENVISVPQGIVAERDGKKFVKVQVGDALEEREVATGMISSLGQAEILSGLSAGDTIVLSESTEE